VTSNASDLEEPDASHYDRAGSRPFLLGSGCATPSNDQLTANKDLVRLTSRNEFIQLQKSFLASFPDQRVTLQQVIAEGDHVAVLATYSGTQTGPMEGFPTTGKAVAAPFLALFRIESGRIAELWVEWDNMALLKQLGLLPPATSS
jgi:steroid delta-isomerase-like uncharacterized protein